MNPPVGTGMPAKEDREEVPERGETLAGRTAMQAPRRLEEMAQEETAVERAQIGAEERAEVGAEERAEETREEAMEEAIKAVARGSFKEQTRRCGRLAAKN